MISSELIAELQNLSRADKLRIVQILVNALAVEEETLLVSGGQYEIWSPYDSASAAEALQKMLEEEQQT